MKATVRHAQVVRSNLSV